MIHPPPEPVRELAPAIPGLPADLARWAREVIQIVALTAALYLVINTFLVQPYEVEMRSMEPTLAGGDHVLVDKLSPRWDAYDRGDVVVFDAPAPYDDEGIPYIKRVIGVAGDTIQLLNGHVYVTPAGGVPVRLDETYLDGDVPTLPQGAPGHYRWTVPDGSVFVLGDNRTDSVDSRTFGAIDIEDLIGRAWLRYLPLDRVSVLGSAPGAREAGAGVDGGA